VYVRVPFVAARGRDPEDRMRTWPCRPTPPQRPCLVCSGSLRREANSNAKTLEAVVPVVNDTAIRAHRV
jgi:hypothetical protein